MIAKQLRAAHDVRPLGSFQYLATDLDGTLLDPSGAVTAATVAALGRAKGVGMRTAIATARPLRLVTPLLSDELREVLDALIVTNGAAIYDAADGELLHEDALSVAHTATAMSRVRELWPEAVFGWETGQDFWSEAAFLDRVRAGGILRDPDPQRLAELPGAPVHQLVFVVPGIEPASCVERAAEALGASVSVTESHGGVVELSAPLITKGDAVSNWILARNSAHSIADAITFGDGHNDLSMLLSAGAGVAMGNAANDIQECARFVTSSNRDDGVAAFVEAYLEFNAAEGVR